MEIIFLNILKILGKESTRGGPPTSHEGGGRAPASRATWQALNVHVLLYGVFCPGKNHKEAYGTKRRLLEAEPGQDQSRAPEELFCLGNIPLGGGNQRHRHPHRSSHREGVNVHQQIHQHHLISNPSSSLVSHLFLKTSDWYMWVASSVDYSL